MLQSILQSVVESVHNMSRRQQPPPQSPDVDVAPNPPITINQTHSKRYNQNNRTRRPYQPSTRTPTGVMNQIRSDPPIADPPVAAPAGTAVAGSIHSNSTDTHTTTTSTNIQTTNPITDTHEPEERKEVTTVVESTTTTSTTPAPAVAVEEEFVTVGDSSMAIADSVTDIPQTPYQLVIPDHPTCLRGAGRIHLNVFRMVPVPLAQRIYEYISRQSESCWSESQVGSFESSYISHHERVSAQLRLHDDDAQLLANHLIDRLGFHGIAANRFEHSYAIRYQTNQFWRPHYSNYLTTDNPRAGSVILFVNSLQSHEGGEVRFPTLGCQIRPVSGFAVFFKHVNRDDERLMDALFEELPVLGTTIKYVIHMHIRRKAIVNTKEMVEP